MEQYFDTETAERIKYDSTENNESDIIKMT